MNWNRKDLLLRNQPDSGPEQLWDWWTAMTSWWLQKNSWIFHEINHPAIGVSPINGNPQVQPDLASCLPSANQFFSLAKEDVQKQQANYNMTLQRGTVGHWAQVNHGSTVTEKHEERQISGVSIRQKKHIIEQINHETSKWLNMMR